MNCILIILLKFVILIIGFLVVVGGCFVKRDWKILKNFRLDIYSMYCNIFKENIIILSLFLM